MIPTELLRMLPPEIRKRYLINVQYGEHKCSGLLRECCDTKFCEPCYFGHIREVHGEHAAIFAFKLAQSGSLTWKPNYKHGFIPKPIVSKKKKHAVSSVIISEFIKTMPQEEILRIANEIKKRWNLT